jgi:predicted nucleic acid-binding protein
VDRFVLSDAAPLICLAQVDGLRWLGKLFSRIHLTEEVRDEVLTGLGKPGEEALAGAIERRLLRIHPEWNWPEPQFPSLGKGEASCIRASINLKQIGRDCLLLLDDREARRFASSATIAFTGTAAIVGAAKQTGLISSARVVFDQLRKAVFEYPKRSYKASWKAWVRRNPEHRELASLQGTTSKNPSRSVAGSCSSVSPRPAAFYFFVTEFARSVTIAAIAAKRSWPTAMNRPSASAVSMPLADNVP